MKNKYLAASTAIILLYLSPLIIFGQDSLVSIHDILDLDHVRLKVLSQSEKIFSGNSENIPNFLGGVSRSVMGSELDLQLWLHYFFGSFPAYALNQFFMRFIAFIGMYRLLRHFPVFSGSPLIVYGVSTTYALLPFFSVLGLSGPAQPLVLAAFLAIRKNQGTWVDWAAIVLVPLYASFIHVYVFFLALMGCLWFYDWLVKRTRNYVFLWAVFLMGAISLLVNYRIIYAMFVDSGFVSHRTELYKPPASLYIAYLALKKSLEVFLWGHLNAKSLHGLIILPVILIGLFVQFDKSVKYKNLPLILIVLAVFSVMQGAEHLAGSLKTEVPLLRVFSFNRFFYLNPMLWYIAFAISLGLLASHARKGMRLVAICLCLQIAVAFFYHDEVQMRHGKPTYRQFFSEKLFQEISDYIGREKKDFRVVSIGMHPSIASYNGFHTVDGYLGSYPLSHKHAFRKIISGELEKDEALRRYFDWGGSRCYVFSAELTLGDWLYTKNRTVAVKDLQLNMEQLVKMGGEYIFSAVEIANHRQNNMEFIKLFQSESSGWKIYLYQPEERAG